MYCGNYKLNNYVHLLFYAFKHRIVENCGDKKHCENAFPLHWQKYFDKVVAICQICHQIFLPPKFCAIQ